VISFRNLQLKRITDMQDELLGYAVKANGAGTLSDDLKPMIDKALKECREFPP
jgi:hypothetical protein